MSRTGLIDWWNVAFMSVPDEYERAYPTHARTIAVKFMDAMACLGRNLATAGALTRSFDLGAEHGRVGNRYGFAYGRKRPWWPNVIGFAVPCPGDGRGRGQ